MSAKLNAEIATLTAALYDWHAGRWDRRRFVAAAGQVANAAELARLEAIPKFGYSGRDGLRVLVARAYLGS